MIEPPSFLKSIPKSPNPILNIFPFPYFMMSIRTATTTYLNNLNHFLKRTYSQSIGGQDLCWPGRSRRNRPEIVATRKGVVVRTVLNHIQADELTEWDENVRRLQKAYGSGRWSPKEDQINQVVNKF